MCREQIFRGQGNSIWALEVESTETKTRIKIFGFILKKKVLEGLEAEAEAGDGMRQIVLGTTFIPWFSLSFNFFC